MATSSPTVSLGVGPVRLFERAAAFHAQGRLREAEQLYESVLAADIGHYQSVYGLGLIRLHQGRFAEAEPLFRRAVKLDKRSADAQHHLAIALTGLQRLEEAISRYEKALALRPRYAEAHNNLGHALQILGRHEIAARHYRRALAINPGYFEACNNLGNALAALQRTDDAVEQYQQALTINPDFAEAHNNLATALTSLGCYAEAVPHCEKAIALRPGYLEAQMNLANAFAALGRLDQAIGWYEQALAVNPDHVEAHTRLAHTLLLLERSEEALKHCERALALNPRSHIALHDLGNLLWKLRHPQVALDCYNRALAVEPGYIPALTNRANVLIELRVFDEALASYVKAQALDPHDAEAHFGEALLRLRLGELRVGFAKHEWRGKLKDRPSLHTRFDKPIWLGQSEIAGRTILVHAEQGFGDTLQFCRYAQLLAERGAKVVVEVQPALKSLMASLTGVETVVAKGEPLPGFDVHCPVMSLPLAFDTTVESIPGNTPYLDCAPDRVAKWRQMLGAGIQPRVGLAWSGNPKQLNDHNRSILLRECLPLFLPGIEFVSLQKEVRPRDLEVLKSCQGLTHFGDALVDFSDTAALISCMDLVISVCTSVGHLAGALNMPVWFLLSDAADWRWLLHRNNSPWYPSARLFRQPQLGDWASIIRQVAAELARLK